EYESSGEAQQSLFASLPLGYLLMFIITVLLFNELRSSLVIWACVPLAIIGVSFGMLLLGAEFGFMALLGFLSLFGMILQNGMLPLLFDPFFSAMAVVISAGLGFATILTLGVVPVLYAISHGIRAPQPH